MFELRFAPARPRQSVVIALAWAFGGAQRNQIEILLVRHVQLDALGRLAGIAGTPAAAVYLAQNVFGNGPIAFDGDVLEHRVGEAELLRHEIDDLVVVLGLEQRLDDRSPHWIERFEATREPELSNWVQAGSR